MEKRSCYQQLSLIEYYGLVKNIAENRRQELQILFNLLIKKFGDKDWSLILVGSDGKQERHPQSKTEVVLVYKDKQTKDQNADKMAQVIKTLTYQATDPIEFSEIKVLADKNGENPLSFYNNQPHQCYPDRILNADFLLGDDAVFIQAKRKTLLEAVEEGKLGKTIREELKKQLKVYKKTLTSGQYRHQIVFDENNQYYFETDDWRNVRTGFKMGPIRAVQRRLDLLTLNAVRCGKLIINELVADCPSNTCERIEFLVKRGVIDQKQEKIIVEAYLWFLREYHRIQELFKNSNRQSLISCQFDEKEFERHRKALIDFIT